MKRHLITPTLVWQSEESIQAIMDLRLDIIKEGNLAVKHAEKSIDHVCAAGKMLIDLKEKVGHGNFRKELDAIDMKKSTAANYMAVFRFVQRGGHLRGGGLRDALRLISKGDPAPVELNTDTPAPEYQLAPPAPKPKAAPAIIDAEIVDNAPTPTPDTNNDDDDAPPLVIDGIKNKPPVKSGGGPACRDNDKILDDYLMAELVKFSPGWATMDADYLSKIEVEERSGDQMRTVINLIYELWILNPTVRAKILAGINTLQPIKL